MHPLLNIAMTAAKAAGDIIIRNYEQLDRLKVSLKGENDYFSDVDIKAEQAIIHTIHKAYPQHGFIAEESGSYQADAESVWLIDPLDGTTNYLHNFPMFAVSIAYRFKNRIEHAVVYDPLRYEFFHASRGEGTKLNDRRIRVSKQTQLRAALLGTAFPHDNETFSKTFSLLNHQCAGIRRIGSAALDLAYIACGRLDGYWVFGLQPWDFAAGSLLIKEAGGLISDMQGEENYFKTGNIIAGTPKIFKGLLQTLLPVTRLK